MSSASKEGKEPTNSLATTGCVVNAVLSAFSRLVSGNFHFNFNHWQLEAQLRTHSFVICVMTPSSLCFLPQPCTPVLLNLPHQTSLSNTPEVEGPHLGLALHQMRNYYIVRILSSSGWPLVPLKSSTHVSSVIESLLSILGTQV